MRDEHMFCYECVDCGRMRALVAVSQSRADRLMRETYTWRSVRGRWLCSRHPRAVSK